MCKSVRIVISVLAILLLAACQPTPEKAAVVYGRDFDEKITQSSNSLAAYDAPKSWQETIDMKGSQTSVKIDAVISVPDVTAFPVCSVRQALPDALMTAL